MPDHIDIKFFPSGRGQARCAPNPDFLDGVEIDGTNGDRSIASCLTTIPYPAPECGQWLLTCRLCSLTVLITAAGRPDDPRSARVPCQKEVIPNAMPS